MNTYTEPVSEFSETVVSVNRVSKKTKGGNQMRFSALIVVGDKKGQVGVGLAKGLDVRTAITKASTYAKRHLFVVPMKGTTVPYEVFEKYGASKVLLKPAPVGSGIIAGGPMRVVLEAAGIRDAVGKILGSSNKTLNVYATLSALQSLKKISDKKEARNELGKK